MDFLWEGSVRNSSAIYVKKEKRERVFVRNSISDNIQKRNKICLSGTIKDFLDMNKGCRRYFTKTQLMDLYAKVDMLIIEDLAENILTRDELSWLFVIVNERMKNKLPIVILTKFNINDLKKRLSIHEDDCKFVNSIISRLRFMCTLVDIRKNIIIE